MRYGTYTCSLASGGTEYGFCFGKPAYKRDKETTGPCEILDSEFDVVIGVAHDWPAMRKIEAQLRSYEWVAKAIIEESKRREEGAADEPL